MVSFISFLCGAMSCHAVVEEMRLLCSKHDARLQTILRNMLRFIIAHYISDVDNRHTSSIKEIVAGICACGDITLVNCALQVSQQLGSNVVLHEYFNSWSCRFLFESASQALLLYVSLSRIYLYMASYCYVFPV